MPRTTEHRWAVDGIEEGIARIEEDGARMISVPVAQLPSGTREGDLLRVVRAGGDSHDSQVLTIARDDAGAESARRQSHAATDAAMTESRTRDPGGDVAL